jgi:hypothetical protein
VRKKNRMTAGKWKAIRISCAAVSANIAERDNIP